jgi:hypothetical protein
MDISFLPRISFLFGFLLIIVGYLFYTKAHLPQINILSLAYILLVLISIGASLQSLNPTESILGVLKLAGGFLSYFILFNLFGNTIGLKERILPSLCILFLGVIAVNNLVIVWQIWEKGSFLFKEKELETFSGLMSNKNLGAEFYATLLPFFVFYEAKSLKGIFFNWGLPIFIIVFSVFIQARGAFIASIIGWVMCLGIQWQGKFSEFKVILRLAIALTFLSLSFLIINLYD